MTKWNETTEDIFNEMCSVLPPAAYGPGAFLVGEAFSHKDGKPTFQAFMEKDGKFFVASEAMTFAEFEAEFPDAEYFYG